MLMEYKHMYLGKNERSCLRGLSEWILDEIVSLEWGIVDVG